MKNLSKTEICKVQKMYLEQRSDIHKLLEMIAGLSPEISLMVAKNSYKIILLLTNADSSTINFFLNNKEEFEEIFKHLK